MLKGIKQFDSFGKSNTVANGKLETIFQDLSKTSVYLIIKV